jgi:hypothetical protein
MEDSMNSFRKSMLVGGLALAAAIAPASRAQAINSNVATVNLNAVLAESLTVAAAPATVNFALVPNGVANGSSSITVTTNWALGKTRTSMKVYAYFSSAVGLTDGAGDNIPTSSVLGSVNAGAFAAFTGGAGPFGVNSQLVFNQVVGGAGTFNATHVDTVALRIDTTGLALPAATYIGVLNIQAQAL